ncbi:arylesterase [Sulfitobacter sp. S190]|uniref:arylesterase n=1 Tax=Sulfitobacter sp. S190 TaxID=2867022 RepID=UPI0021A67B73|nr:arylesterase [Sulfitobacter sp. S190]UWR22062.1 arylesterase [Sulfitobacter sp. S190]
MRKVWGLIMLLMATPATAEEIVIAALGDSLTQGYGLPAEQGLVPQLQRWLDDRNAEVTLINAGVSGDTTAGGLARVGWTLTPQVDAMIVALGGNDLLRGLPPEQARANVDGILQAAQTADVEVLLVGMEAPGNFGESYKTSFDALYPDLAAQYGTLLMRNFFEGLIAVAGTDAPAQLRSWFQPDGIHPNAEGVALIVDALGPKVLALVAAARDT